MARGDEELVQLAHMLRLAASAASDLAWDYLKFAPLMMPIADRINEIAAEVEHLSNPDLQKGT